MWILKEILHVMLIITSLVKNECSLVPFREPSWHREKVLFSGTCLTLPHCEILAIYSSPTPAAPPKPQTSHWKTEYPINLRGLLEINVSRKNSSNKNGYQLCKRFFVIGLLFLSFRWCFCPFYCILLNFQDAIFKLDIKAHLVKVPVGRREFQWNPINLFSKYYILYREIGNQSVSISIVMIAPKYSH